MNFDLSISSDLEYAKKYFYDLCEKKSRIIMTKITQKRTISQNKYFYVCCKILSNYSGYTTDEIKVIIKDQLEFMTYVKNGHRFYVSSADLDKMDFMALTEFTRSFGEQHGCFIPTPEQYIESQFEIDREYQI